MSHLTPIQEFYKDSIVFLTGVTGFVGKAVLEKILRSCPDVKRIYVLIRAKKGVNSEERLLKSFNSPYFDALKSDNPNFKDCISIMNGDLLQENLGLSENDINILINEVNIVIHIAATVRFDEKLKIAAKLNIVALKGLLAISKTIRHLKSFVHVSTAYAHCYNYETEEEFYKPLRDPNEFIKYLEKINDEELDEASIIGAYPNTYTYTKGLAEDIVRIEGKGLPLCIVRPSIVIGSWAEPLPGWVDNLAGPLGLMAGVGYGLVRCNFGDGSKLVDIIPVDMTANAIIAAATANTTNDSITIFQLTTGTSNPITWFEFVMWCKNFAYPYASPKSLWIPSFSFTKCIYAFHIYKFILHTIPSHIADFLLKIMRKKPMFVKIFKKVNAAQTMLLYFTTNEWKFHDDNTRKLFFSLNKQDQQIFNFDVKQIEWDLYCLYNIRRTRINLMKDPLSTVPAGLKNFRRFRIVNITVLILFIYFIFYLVCFIF